jgi:ferredoxin
VRTYQTGIQPGCSRRHSRSLVYQHPEHCRSRAHFYSYRDRVPAGTMYVKIDRCACIRCGACWNICPEVFGQNPCDEYSELVDAYRFCGSRAEGEIPEDLASCAQEAADLCPVEIIEVGER